jgi:hypothetical protein
MERDGVRYAHAFRLLREEYEKRVSSDAVDTTDTKGVS